MNAFSVSQFIEFLNVSLSTAVFPEGVWVEGEVIDYRVSQDRWIWFQLKDESAIVSCFATVWQMRTPLEDGMKVRAFGLPKVHPKSGKFSLNVERVELVGEGALRRSFELLKKKLTEEGLFDVGRKRAIPRFPQRIGLIASAESAAYGDFMRILGNRWGGVEVTLVDVSVQGRDAVAQITAAFRWFNARPEAADVLVLTRGGGSMEDLQAFNAEEVARAVFSSVIPVVVGVGHERDESLADYAADVRASTPSNAAERVVPDRREMEAFIDGGTRRMDAAMRSAVMERQEAVGSAVGHLEGLARRRLEAVARLVSSFASHAAIFEAKVRERGSSLTALADRLASGAGYWTARVTHRFDSKVRLLKTLDPLRPLARGYALVTAASGVVTDASKVAVGDRLNVRLRHGMLAAEVKDVQDPQTLHFPL